MDIWLQASSDLDDFIEKDDSSDGEDSYEEFDSDGLDTTGEN